MSRALTAMLIVGAMCGRAQAQSMPVDVEERTAAGWTFTPGASLGGAWDSGINTASNPFVENVFQRWVGLVNPWADLNFTGRRGRFNAGYSGAFEKYWDSDLNWEQHSRVGAGRTFTRRFSGSADLSYSAAPTTDRLLLVEGTIPYIDIDSAWLNMGGALAYQLGRKTSVDLSYYFQRVTLDRPEGFVGPGTLHDGHSWAPALGVMHGLSERLAIGGRGELRREYVSGPPDQPDERFDVGSATGEFTYRLSPVTIINGGAGVTRLQILDTYVDTVAPTFHGGFDHQRRRVRVNASFERAFQQLYGFGTLAYTNTFYGSITMPLADRLYYLKGTVSYNRTDAIEEIGIGFNIDSLWLDATVGRQLTPYVRAEGFVTVSNQSQQVGLWPGANRHRFGIQIVTSKPMRKQ